MSATSDESRRALDLLDLGERYATWSDTYCREAHGTPWYRPLRRLWHAWYSARYDRLSNDAYRQAAVYSGGTGS